MRKKHLSNKFNPPPPAKNDGESRMTIENGEKIWRDAKNQFHRLDGPAIEWQDGTKYWYVNHELHRTDGPAVERPDGREEWWCRGRPHRLDGPAFTNLDGTQEWWIHGRMLDEAEIERHQRSLQDERLRKSRETSRAHLERLDRIFPHKPRRPKPGA